jgi:hypothetical protein
VLERTIRRLERHLRRRGLLGIDEDGADPDLPGDPESNLAASAVSGQTPAAGPQWLRGLEPLEAQALAYDKPLCAALDGFTLPAATRAGALDPAGREALLRYVLRPPIAQERLLQRPDGLVRITLKKAYSDRPACARGRGSRPRERPCRAGGAGCAEPDRGGASGGYRPWAELLARTFDHATNYSSP